MKYSDFYNHENMSKCVKSGRKIINTTDYNSYAIERVTASNQLELNKIYNLYSRGEVKLLEIHSDYILAQAVTKTGRLSKKFKSFTMNPVLFLKDVI